MSSQIPSPAPSREPERTRQQLETQYNEIAALAGGLAHEIRNPLSTIRMNLELIVEEVQGSADPHLRRTLTKLERIRKECLHLEDILSAFLQFARAGELQLETVDLGDFVTQFMELFQPQADEQKVVLIPHLAADLPPVRIDPRLMRQVLMNLALNALQAMPEGGQIELQTYAGDGWVHLEIIDTGCGIAAAARDRVFQIFFSTKPLGSGLGLPTARKIVEAHGGRITCDSEVGRGTRFRISLPVSVGDPLHSGDPAAPSMAGEADAKPALP